MDGRENEHDSNVRAVLTARSGQKLQVRRLGRELLPALRQFARALSERTRRVFAPHGYDVETLEKYLRRDQSGQDRIYCLLAGPRVVGYFFLWEFDRPVPVLGIGLADDYQGQGLGRQMMAVLIEDAKAAGRQGIELTTVPANERAFALYEKMGFQYVRDLENVAGDGRVVVERAMFLPLAAGAKPVRQKFSPPV